MCEVTNLLIGQFNEDLPLYLETCKFLIAFLQIVVEGMKVTSRVEVLGEKDINVSI